MSDTGPVGEKPRLYGYWRSTAAYRVRIALGLKGIEWQSVPVHLVQDGGQQHGAAYREVNPSRLVPALEIDGQVLTQSLAICEYLDERWPEPPLLPADPSDRAWVRSLALDVACDLHPLNNLRVQQHLRRQWRADDSSLRHWMHHWMDLVLTGVEERLSRRGDPGPCVLGEKPGLADLCLVAQAYNCDRFGFELKPFPQVSRVLSHCRALPAFRAAEPERQPDAPVSPRRGDGP